MNIPWLIVGTLLCALGCLGVVTWVTNGYHDTPLAVVQAGMFVGGLTVIAWAAS